MTKRRNPRNARQTQPGLGESRERVAVELLRRYDGHPDAGRRITFRLLFRSKRKASLAIKELQCLGFLSKVAEAGKQYRVMASRFMIPSLSILIGMRRVLTDIACRCDGHYEGWSVVLLDG